MRGQISELGPAGQTLVKARSSELHQISPFLPRLCSFLGFGLLTVGNYQTEVRDEAGKGFNFFFNWSIVALQCCVNICCIAK